MNSKIALQQRNTITQLSTNSSTLKSKFERSKRSVTPFNLSKIQTSRTSVFQKRRDSRQIKIIQTEKPGQLFDLKAKSPCGHRTTAHASVAKMTPTAQKVATSRSTNNSLTTDRVNKS